MDPQTQKVELDIQERITILPEEITDLFTLGIVTSVLDETQRSYNLSVTQYRLLKLETELVLMLFVPRTGFAERVAQELEISFETSQAIDNHLEEEVFRLVEDILEDVDKSFSQNPSTETDAETLGNDLTSINFAPASVQTQDEHPTTARVSSTIPDQVKDAVPPVRTMEGDMDIIHGYGSYRQLYPNAESEGTPETPPQRPTPTPETPAAAANEPEPVIEATPQAEVLENRPSLTKTPSYEDPTSPTVPPQP